MFLCCLIGSLSCITGDYKFAEKHLHLEAPQEKRIFLLFRLHESSKTPMLVATSCSCQRCFVQQIFFIALTVLTGI